MKQNCGNSMKKAGQKTGFYLFIVLYIFQQKKITFYNFGNLFLSLYFNYYLFLLTISPTT